MLIAKTQAILLLTAYFTKAGSSDVKPLTNKEWGRFAFWLKNQELSPEDLLTGDIKQKLSGWTDGKITLDRIQVLLNRGSALAMAMEKWTRAGLWVLTRSDLDYPKILKARLGNDAPPVFFGCGNRKLLGQGGIAVIGSRKTSDADLLYSRQLGEKATYEGRSIVSGGARGVDEAAMLGALESEGTAVGILANDLLRAATSSRYRKYLMANNLVLVSPFYPEAGFNAGNAMQRNKYIYCLSNAAIAVHSGTSGGTWNGALENIKHGWVPMWIKPTSDPEAGNAALVESGANWLPETVTDIDLNGLVHSLSFVGEQGSDLFARTHPEIEPESTSNKFAVTEDETDIAGPCAEQKNEKVETEAPEPELDEPPDVERRDIAEDVSQLSLYEHFLLLVEQEASSPKTVEELLEITQLHRTQLNEWLKQAVSSEKVIKFTRPVRYQWAQANQHVMFEEK
ncbi:MAG: DNA processing protein DprA [Porticoccaceae bacterium]|nr:DNA processing protein DprA [Porticoccaceae bacterium]